jgi:hypothetical protein
MGDRGSGVQGGEMIVGAGLIKTPAVELLECDQPHAQTGPDEREANARREEMPRATLAKSGAGSIKRWRGTPGVREPSLEPAPTSDRLTRAAGRCHGVNFTGRD